MPKSVCAKCEVELKPEENGVIVAEMMRNNTEIYKLWEADLWKCPECGVEVVLGFALQAFMEHFEGDINAKLDEMKLSGRRIIYDKERTGGD